MTKTYFTSDLHLGHKWSINYDNRPFSDVDNMDQEIIRRWNNKVQPDDIVYILGDFSWYKTDKTIEILKQLNGHKRLIKGNHDRIHDNRLRKCFDTISNYEEIKINDNLIILCHYPIPWFNKHYYGSYMFYGHVHNSTEWHEVENVKQMIIDRGQPCNMFNVGCMLWDYEPVSFEEITTQNYKIIERSNSNK